MIHTINHIGIGVQDVDKSGSFYRQFLNYSFKLNDDEYAVWELEPIFKRKPRMRVQNWSNPRGGPGLEFFQHRDTPPRLRNVWPRWSDIGLMELGVLVQGIDRVSHSLQDAGVPFLTPITPFSTRFGESWQSAYLRSPDGVLIQLIEKPTNAGKHPQVLGISHLGIGVSNLGSSLSFYKDTLGFDQTIHHTNVDPHHLETIMPGSAPIETVLLARKKGSTSKLSSFDGGMIKLVHCPEATAQNVFSGRRFGDPGLTEIGLEVADVVSAFRESVEKGANPLVPPTDFDLGFGPRGTLAYIADPDGVVIEFVSLKSLFKLPPVLLDWLTVRPLRGLAKLGLI